VIDGPTHPIRLVVTDDLRRSRLTGLKEFVQNLQAEL